jgi:ribulose-5-phosphate 4-epimerase/fuculose-1-phosphate aldolase
VYSPDAAERRAAREQLATFSAPLLDDGLAVGNAGNLGMRCGDLIAITPFGIGYSQMSPGLAGTTI